MQYELSFATAQPTKITVQEWEMRYLKALMREYRTLQKELSLLALSAYYDYEAKEWEVRDLNSKTTVLKLKFTELSVEEYQQRLREALYALAAKDGAIPEGDGLMEVRDESSEDKNRANFLRKREGGQTADDLPPVPVSRADLRKVLLRKRATSGATRPDILKLVESVKQAVYPHFAVEFYADQSKLYLYLCDYAQAFKRLEIDLSGGLSYAGALQIANEVKRALQEVRATIQNTVKEKQNDQAKLLESFLNLAGLDLQDIREVLAFATQIQGLGWKVQGSRLRWLIDGVEVDGLDLDLWELRGLGKEAAKERILITIERVAEIEPTGG